MSNQQRASWIAIVLTVCVVNYVDGDEPSSSRRDVYGDPLPPGAVARMGTTRVRGIQSLAVSPDGQTLVTGGSLVRIWDAFTGKLLFQLTGQGDDIRLARGGRWVVGSGSRNVPRSFSEKYISIWDTDTRTLLHELPISRSFFGFDVSADGRHLAAAVSGRDPGVKIWMLDKDGSRLMSERPGKMHRVAFSPKGDVLACWHIDKREVQFIDVASGKLLRKIEPAELVACCGFWPRGNVFATATAEGIIQFWKVDSGLEFLKLTSTFPAPTHRLNCIAFSPDGKTFVAGTGDYKNHRGHIEIWDLTEKKRVQQFEVHHTPQDVAFTPDGKRIVFRNMYAARVIDARTGAEMLPLVGHYHPINALSFSPDGKTLATGTYNENTFRLWDTASGQQTLKKRPMRVNRIRFAPSGKHAAITSGLLNVLDMASQKVLSLGEEDWGCGAAEFSPDGNLLVGVFGDKTRRLSGYTKLGIWNGESIDYVRSVPLPGGNLVDLAFSRDGRYYCMACYLAAANASNYVHVRDARTHDTVLRYSAGNWKIDAVKISPDGRMVAVSQGQKGIIVLEIPSGKQLHRLRSLVRPNYSHRFSTLDFTSDSSKLMGGLRRICIWDLKTGEKLREFGDNEGTIALSGDDKYVVTGDYDGNLRLWDFATGEKLAQWRGHDYRITRLAFACDGRKFASSARDCTAVVWDLNKRFWERNSDKESRESRKN